MALVILDTDRQIHLREQPGGDFLALTGSGDVNWASWKPSTQDLHSWPTIRSDGREVASFRISRDGESTRLLVTDSEGSSALEVAEFTGQLPITLAWSPTGENIAVLTQDKRGLKLHIVDLANRTTSQLLTGSPLFFSWFDNKRVVAFAGEKEVPALVIVGEGSERVELTGPPGNFCTPLRCGTEGVAYGMQGENGLEVRVEGPNSEGRSFDVFDGLAALMPSPCGRYLACAIAADGGGSPYRNLVVYNLVTLEKKEVANFDLVAFFWIEGSEALVLVQKRADTGYLRWIRQEMRGERLLLAEHRPSRDFRFYLRFFEQYSHSHSVLSADGQRLVLPGWVRGQDFEEPGIYEVNTKTADVTRLTPGVFACYGGK